MSQVPSGDFDFLRMGFQPSGTFGEKLFDFIGAYEVMLHVVEDRNEHVEMSEKFRDGFLTAQNNAVIRALPPLGKFRVEQPSFGGHRVSQRFEQSWNHRNIPAHGERIECRR